MAAACDNLLLQDHSCAPRIKFQGIAQMPEKGKADAKSQAPDTTDSTAVEAENASTEARAALVRVATGRLSVGLLAPLETDPILVQLDEGWEELGASLERMLEWGRGLVEKRAQVRPRHSSGLDMQESFTMAASSLCSLSMWVNWSFKVKTHKGELRRPRSRRTSLGQSSR